MLTVGSLFSGIGGFELGLERTGGFETKWQCEIDPFCLKVLAKHWPDIKRFTDIKKMGMEEEIPYVDVICGGFPCQPISCAGKRKGSEDKRWLWPEFYRIVCLVRPEWVLVENVPGLLSANDNRGIRGGLFAGILRDLAESGYDAEWNIVSAASVGAPHLRKRVFIVAHANGRRCGANRIESGLAEVHRKRADIGLSVEKCNQDVADTEISRFEKPKRASGPESAFAGSECGRIFRREPTGTWPIESGFCRMVDGFPGRVDRLRSLGNAIVPQCATYVAECVLEYEKSLLGECLD